MLAHQIVHQREPDARALVRAPLGPAHPVEALEQVRQLARRDAHARVAHHQLDVLRQRAQLDRHLAREGELERVREQVRHDLFPHARVDPHGLGQFRAVDPQPEPRALGGAAEQARDVGRERGEVDRLEVGAQPAGFDLRDVEQRVDEGQEPAGVARGRLDLAREPRGQLGAPSGELVERGEQQGEGRAELVADVREELGLGPVELGQPLVPLALLLPRPRLGQARARVRRDEVEELAVRRVERQARAEAEGERAGRPLVAAEAHRQQQGGGGPAGLGGGARAEAAARQVAEGDGRAVGDHLRQGPDGVPAREAQRPRREGAALVEADGAGEVRARPGLVEQVGEREGHVVGVAGERLDHARERLARRRRPRRARGERVQRAEPPRAEHPARRLERRHDDAPDGPRLVAHRREAQVEPGVFERAGARDGVERVLDGDRLAAEHARVQGLVQVPDLGPPRAAGLREASEVLPPHERAVGVVVDRHALGPPEQARRRGALEREAGGRAQRRGPGAHGAERRARPVERAQERRRLARPGEEPLGGLALGARHRQRAARDQVDHGAPELVQRQHQVGAARFDRGARHRGLLGRVFALHEHDAARPLDRPRPGRAVAAHAGEHDRERAPAEAVGERREEGIERVVARAARVLVQGAGAVGQGLEARARRADEHAARREGRAVVGPRHRQRAATAQDLDQGARPAQVLHHEHRRRQVGRQPAQDGADGVEPAGRGHERDDVEGRRGRRRQGRVGHRFKLVRSSGRRGTEATACLATPPPGRSNRPRRRDRSPSENRRQRHRKVRQVLASLLPTPGEARGYLGLPPPPPSITATTTRRVMNAPL
ncbi:MAG TPA: hypothetical protein VFS43_00835 [Polyangiaceae bacterium]|nr:hypothetical protein [Polyangiaceae bacterium]